MPRINHKNNTMKNNPYLRKTLLAAAIVILFSAATLAQCVIPISPGQTYSEGFDSGEMECWTVETTGGATWAVMLGTGSNVVAFQNANAGEEARLVSPTFDLTGSSSATFSFVYAMMALYTPDELVVSYRTSTEDNWHQLDSYSVSDWTNTYDASFTLEELSSTFQISFLGRSNGGYYIFVDDINLVPAGGCARPMGLNVSDISANTALLGWTTAGNEESWTLDMNGHEMTVTTQPYLLEYLTPNTEYTFRVKANCGEGMESDWSYTQTFTTLCDVITVTDEMPYFDDFEASDVFVCWESQIVGGEDGWVIDPGYLFPNNTAFFIWLGVEAMLVSAPLDITNVTKPFLTFKHKEPHGNYNNADELTVWYATSLNDYWHLLGEYTDIYDNWESVTFALPEASSTYYIAFKGKSNDADGVYVDDVWVGNYTDDGIHEVSALAVTVSPNPTSGSVTIEANADEGEVTIFDLTGRQITTVELHDGRALLDTSNFTQGMYTARITSDRGVSIVKLVKE